MNENVKFDFQQWAEAIAENFRHRAGVVGVMIGGSIARGQEWEHSDLELGLLVDERLTDLPYFNVIGGRGVEAIQVVRPTITGHLFQIQQGDGSPIAQWPIQLWRGQVVHDPTGVFSQFKDAFDGGLFSDEVVKLKLDLQREKIQDTLQDVGKYLVQERPMAALTRLRYAMNEAILALHWHYGELPRSQNRTDSRLKALCEKYSDPDFYQLYRTVFSLDNAEYAIAKAWPLVRDEVLEITRLWGDSAHDFFEFAVDSNFEWGENAGILTVYRLYIPIIGGEDKNLLSMMDDPKWAQTHQEMLTFLGLHDVSAGKVKDLSNRLSATIREITE